MGFFTTLLVLIPLITLPLVFYRITLILDPKRNKPIRHGRRNPNEPSHLLIVLGSGGHTAEMLSMLERCVSEKDPLLRLDWKSSTTAPGSSAQAIPSAPSVRRSSRKWL